MRLPTRLLSALVLLGASVSAAADDYADARAELVAAYQAQDYDAMVIAAGQSLEARPGYPGALFNLALAEALSGDAPASLQTLNVLLARGIDFGADEMDQFAALRGLPGWDGFQQGIADLYEPIGEAEVALQLDNVGEDEGKTGIFRIDVETGELAHSAILPEYAEDQLLGDLVKRGNSVHHKGSYSMPPATTCTSQTAQEVCIACYSRMVPGPN